MPKFDDLIRQSKERSAPLSGDQIVELRTEAREEMATRAGPGTIILVAATIVIGLVTGHHLEHTAIFVVALLAVALALVARLWAIQRFHSSSAWQDQRDEPLCFIAILLLPLVWGLYSALLIFTYRAEWYGLGILVITVGVVSNIIIPFGAWRSLTTSYIVIVLAPSLCVGLMLQNVYGFFLTFLTIMFAIYLQSQSLNWNRFFWNSRINTALLGTRTAEMFVMKERAEEANRAKSEFVTRMSHELRTPMNAVLGFAQLMEFTADQPDVVRQQAQDINLAGRHLMALIEEILDWSKVESGQLRLKLKTLDVAAVARGVVASLRGATAENVTLVFTVEGELPPVKSDELRVRQVLLNIIGNALKFTESGKVEVLLRLHSDREVLISVRDTGIGIAAEVIDSIFAPFVQADTSATRRFGGTGLGLPISKSLVEMMGGRIAVSSVPGQGSHFEVFLPIDPDAPESLNGGPGEQVSEQETP